MFKENQPDCARNLETISNNELLVLPPKTERQVTKSEQFKTTLPSTRKNCKSLLEFASMSNKQRKKILQKHEDV